MVCAPIAPSFAQGAPAGFMHTYFEEHDYGGVHCPGLTWHIDRVMQPRQDRQHQRSDLVCGR